jgi:hypothetical protein
VSYRGDFYRNIVEKLLEVVTAGHERRGDEITV